MSSVVVKSIDADIVRRAVDDYATRLLAQRDDIEEIVVFGSFTKGTYAPGSDIDLLVVLTWSDQPVRNRVPGLLPGAFPVGIDLFPYTRKELERLVSPGLLREMRASQWRYRRTDSTGDQVRTTDLSRISDMAVVPYRQDQAPRLDFWGSDIRNHTTEGDTLWVNYTTSHFSSRSTVS